jgi:hypothetical protein
LNRLAASPAHGPPKTSYWAGLAPQPRSSYYATVRACPFSFFLWCIFVVATFSMDSAEGGSETTLPAAELDALAAPAQLEHHGLNVRFPTFLCQNTKVSSHTLCTAACFRSRRPTTEFFWRISLKYLCIVFFLSTRLTHTLTLGLEQRQDVKCLLSSRKYSPDER